MGLGENLVILLLSCMGGPILIAIIIIGGLKLGKKSAQYRDWRQNLPATEAEITQLGRVIEVNHSEGSTYRQEIIFTYTVDGRQFTGQEYFGPGIGWASASEAQQTMLEKYPPGTKIEIYYNPDKPEETYFFRYWRKSDWIKKLSGSSPEPITVESHLVSTAEAPPELQPVEFATAEEATRSDASLVPPGKPPWDPKNLIWMAIFFSFAAAGLLAGLNWRRLGKPQWMWPTILISIGAAFIIFVLLPDPPSGWIWVNGGVGVVLTYLQTSTYKEWVAIYGEPTMKKSGWAIPIGISLGTLVVASIMLCPLVDLFLTNPAIKYYRTEIAQTQLPEGCPPDCAGVYLQNANLSGKDLSGANLEEAELYGSNLEDANLSGANLRRAGMSSVLNYGNLRGANLRGADLSKARLVGATLFEADLEKANLRGADLSDATLIKANLLGADLSDTHLSWAFLNGAKIDDSTKIDDKWRLVWEIVNQGAPGRNLSGADLSGTNLSGANLSGANLSGANLGKAWVSPSWLKLRWIDSNEINLSGANLSGANLSGANLSKSGLYEANLNGVDLRGADLSNAWRGNEGKRSGANLSKANLSGANLSGANLNKVNLEGARYNSDTIWPEGFDPEKAGAVQE